MTSYFFDTVQIQQQKQNVRQMKLRQKLADMEPQTQEEETIEEVKVARHSCDILRKKDTLLRF